MISPLARVSFLGLPSSWRFGSRSRRDKSSTSTTFFGSPTAAPRSRMPRSLF